MLMSGFCYKQKHAHHSPEMRNQTRIIIIVFGEKKTKEFIRGAEEEKQKSLNVYAGRELMYECMFF